MFLPAPKPVFNSGLPCGTVWMFCYKNYLLGTFFFVQVISTVNSPNDILIQGQAISIGKADDSKGWHIQIKRSS